jgi:hypothetical protein
MQMKLCSRLIIVVEWFIIGAYAVSLGALAAHVEHNTRKYHPATLAAELLNDH